MDKLKRQHAFQILGKHCPNGLSHDGVIDAITEALDEFPMVEGMNGSTNSPPGSPHWFNTIMGKHLRIGEFLKEKTPNEENVKDWGKILFDTSKEMIAWFNKEDIGQPCDCSQFDEAQGKNYCTSDDIETKRCIGVNCGCFKRK